VSFICTQVFCHDGQLHFCFGTPGPSPGSLNSPFKVTVLKDPREQCGSVFVICDHGTVFPPSQGQLLQQQQQQTLTSSQQQRQLQLQQQQVKTGRIQVFSRAGIYRRRIHSP
jgi:hypothetical protein